MIIISKHHSKEFEKGDNNMSIVEETFQNEQQKISDENASRSRANHFYLIKGFAWADSSHCMTIKRQKIYFRRIFQLRKCVCSVFKSPQGAVIMSCCFPPNIKKFTI